MNIDKQIKEWAFLCESENFEKAKKIGYLGDDKEEKVAEWLNSAYAKWRQHCLEVFTRISNGDEQKAQELFDEFNWLSGKSGFESPWSTEENKYLKPQEHLAKFSQKVPKDDPEIKEMFAKLEKKWDSDNSSVAEYYSTSGSRGGYTGD